MFTLNAFPEKNIPSNIVVLFARFRMFVELPSLLAHPRPVSGSGSKLEDVWGPGLGTSEALRPHSKAHLQLVPWAPPLPSPPGRTSSSRGPLAASLLLSPDLFRNIHQKSPTQASWKCMTWAKGLSPPPPTAPPSLSLGFGGTAERPIHPGGPSISEQRGTESRRSLGSRRLGLDPDGPLAV